MTGRLPGKSGRVVLACAVLAAAIQLIRPARTNPRTDPSRTLVALAQVTPDARGVLERGCRDCHSNDTRWPWYTNVAPVSWFVIDHVNQGRRRFNYSDWAAQTDPDRRRVVLKNTCALSRKGEMPLSTYLWMHTDARLNRRDIDALCDWTAAALTR